MRNVEAKFDNCGDFRDCRFEPFQNPDAPNAWIIYFTYMKGEQLPHEQGEMAIGEYSHPMEHLGKVA